MGDIAASGRPWHLWLVGVLSALWNSVGAFDYTMTQTRNPAYLAQFTPEQLDYFASFPAWATGAWALGVWGAVAGSLLLLFRSRWAVQAFGIALAGLAGTTLFEVTANHPAGLSTTSAWLFLASIWAITALLLWYALRMRARAVLR